MPLDSMMDVFAFVGRGDLDNWDTVSKEFGRRTRRAAPLRTVKSIHVYTNGQAGPYVAVFMERLHTRELGKSSENAAEVAQFFVGALRGCYVERYVSIQDLPIDADFVTSLQAIKSSWKCQGYKVWLVSPDLALGVDVFELLRAFPCYRSISEQTLKFLGEHFHGAGYLHPFLRVGKVDDVLLAQLSSMGVRETGAIVDLGGLSDEAVLDFLFANSGDALKVGQRRCLELRDAKSLSRQFVLKLVKACRACTTNHPFELFVTIDSYGQSTQFIMKPLAEQLRQVTLRRRKTGGTASTFQLVEPDGLKFAITGRRPRGARLPSRDMRMLHVWRYCAPTRQIFRDRCSFGSD